MWPVPGGPFLVQPGPVPPLYLGLQPEANTQVLFWVSLREYNFSFEGCG